MEVKAYDRINVNIEGLHYNQNEWKFPYKFCPERFDHEHEMSLTPSGHKRNPYSWLPFNGGKRVCFGKTFVDCISKVTATYLT